MGDFKQIRRLATAADYAYGAAEPGSVPAIRLVEAKDGGSFGLHPLLDADPTDGSVRLLLPHVSGPSYLVNLEMDSATAGRLGRALLGAQRKADGKGDAEDE